VADTVDEHLGRKCGILIAFLSSFTNITRIITDPGKSQETTLFIKLAFSFLDRKRYLQRVTV
jgi:hypothetical protein